jgi:dTDP-4-amino-4,6-dideoxygalactose transaminase
LIFVDQAESALYDLQQSFIPQGVTDLVEYLVCDVTRQERMRDIFAKFRPKMVYHAAAYKHVPLMESNAVEAVHEGAQLVTNEPVGALPICEKLFANGLCLPSGSNLTDVDFKRIFEVLDGIFESA